MLKFWNSVKSSIEAVFHLCTYNLKHLHSCNSKLLVNSNHTQSFWHEISWKRWMISWIWSYVVLFSCLHQTWTLANHIKLFWLSWVETYAPQKKNLWKKLNLYTEIQKSFISTVWKSKQLHVTRFFPENAKHLKNAWKRIKKIMSWNCCDHAFPNTITLIPLILQIPLIIILLK